MIENISEGVDVFGFFSLNISASNIEEFLFNIEDYVHTLLI
jgi:hypothetical protein